MNNLLLAHKKSVKNFLFLFAAARCRHLAKERERAKDVNLFGKRLSATCCYQLLRLTFTSYLVKAEKKTQIENA